MSSPPAPPDWSALLKDPQVEALIHLALREDLGDRGDVTTQNIFEQPSSVRAWVVARTSTVVCGLPLAAHLFGRTDPGAEIEILAEEGDRVEAGTRLLAVRGDARTVLVLERTVLNFLMRLCGIAAAASRAQARVPDGCPARIFDTRKTVPGWRLLDKAAVATGGGANHRIGLFDMAMIKDNHVAAAGSVSEALARVRKNLPGGIPVEVEIDSLDQLDEALAGKPDIILLDNFSLEDLRTAVSRIDGRVQTEASGGITLETIADIARTGVDRISLGALTHTVVPADLALDMESPG